MMHGPTHIKFHGLPLKVTTEITFKYKSWHSECENSWVLGRMPCSLVFCPEEEEEWGGRKEKKKTAYSYERIVEHVWNVMAHAQKPAKRTSPFKSAGGSVQSTAGSRGVLINGSNAGYTIFWGRVQDYWLPIPLSCFPFTSPTVRRRVPSGFNWALPIYRSTWRHTPEGSNGHSLLKWPRISLLIFQDLQPHKMSVACP